MNRRERTRRVAWETKRGAEGRPVRSAVYVRVFDQYDRLLLACVACAKERIEVVYSRQVRRHQRIGSAKRIKCEVRPGLAHLVQGDRLDVIQGDYAHDRRGQRRGNLRIIHIGDVPLAFEFKMVNW